MQSCCSRYLGLLISVVPQPAIGFSEVIKHMDPPLGGAGLQHDGGGGVHLCADPAAMEDVEDQHAEEEHRANDANISGQLLLGVAEEVESVERRGFCAFVGGVLHPILEVRQELSNLTRPLIGSQSAAGVARNRRQLSETAFYSPRSFMAVTSHSA